MKLAVAILLCILSLPTAGRSCTMAGGHGSFTCAAAPVNSGQARLDGGRQLILSRNVGHDGDDTILARADDDDEETINRKYLSVTGYFLAFTWALISTDRYALHTEHSSIWRDLSCPGSRIYIAQRVLRI